MDTRRETATVSLTCHHRSPFTETNSPPYITDLHCGIQPPPEGFYDKVSIGDVGYVSQGGEFIRLFNVTLPWDHESNRVLGKPDHYEPLSCGPFANISKGSLEKGKYCSRYVTTETNAGNNQAMGPDE
jgi:hypothetical protein